MKKCPMCKTIKPVSEFSKNTYTKDKLCCQCKQCMREYMRQRRKDNPEYYRAIRKRSYYRYRDKELEQHRKYANSEHGKEVIKKLYAKYKKDGRLKNPEKSKARASLNHAIDAKKIPPIKTRKCTH